MPAIGHVTSWDEWFIGLASYVSTRSKDPEKKVGAVLSSPDRKVVGIGYNGFPSGIADLEERLSDKAVKRSLVIHAEVNAIMQAGRDAKGATLYVWPLFTCGDCAKLVIQSGVSRVVAPSPKSTSSWKTSCEHAMAMYREAGLMVEEWG